MLSLQIWNKSNVHQKCPRKVNVSIVLFGVTVASAFVPAVIRTFLPVIIWL